MELKLKDLAKDHEVGLNALMAVLAYLYSDKVRLCESAFSATLRLKDPGPNSFGGPDFDSPQLKGYLRIK